MPSRGFVIAIVLFWLGTTGYVIRQDWWPRLFGSGPPPVRIDLADEATQSVPVTWNVLRNGQIIGSLITRTQYESSDDTFRFVSTYRNLKFSMQGITIVVPSMETSIRTTRAGALREQSMAGRISVSLGLLPLGEASAKVEAVVVDDVLQGHCTATLPLGFGKLERPLEPVAVSGGQVLNPMQPFNRLQDVRPGRRWAIQQSDPLAEAIAAVVNGLAEQQGFKLPPPKRVTLIAEVRSAPESIDRKDKPVLCHVIDYRGEGVSARTWVSVEDGRVMRQEATNNDESLRLDRQD